MPQALCHRGVWPDGVVVNSPPFRQHPDLLYRIEDFAVQELVPQLRIEGLAVPVFAPVPASHFRSPLATNSGPLSERRCSGTPFIITITSASASMTFAELHLR